jgi:hypothetical protein
MPQALYNLSLYRMRTSQTVGHTGYPDVQAEAVARDVSTYLASLPSGTAPTATGLAAALQHVWPGSTVETVSRYYWYVTPGGPAVWVCVNEQVAITQQSGGTGTVPVDPPIGVGFQLQM